MDIASIEKIFEEAYEAKLKEVEAEYQYKISTLEKQLKSLSLAQSTNPFEESANIEAKKRADDLQKQLDAVIAERDTVELKRKGVWKKYDNLAAQMEGLRENHKKERDGLTAKITELARKLNDADDLDSIKAKEENLNLKQLCDIKDQEIAQWKRKTADITMILDSGKKMYDDLNTKHQELNTKHKELNGKHRELNGKYTEINGKYAELDNKYNTLVDKWNKLVVSNKAICEELSGLKQQSRKVPISPSITTVENGITTTIDNVTKNCVLVMPNYEVERFNQNMFKKYISIFGRSPKYCIKLYNSDFSLKIMRFQYLDGVNANTERFYGKHDNREPVTTQYIARRGVGENESSTDVGVHIGLMYNYGSDQGLKIKQFTACREKVEVEHNAAEAAIIAATFYKHKIPGYAPLTDSIIAIDAKFDTTWMNL
ncbi:hypothetical protein F-E9_385 [Faustovirus]|nr:hypothetical protein F-E9_385 [Faustovirus]